MASLGLIVLSELPRKQPSTTGAFMTGGSPIRWVHDQILRNDYGAVSLVTITDANAQQYLPAEARILVANLPRSYDPEVLREQLKGVFSYFGLNWVHIENRCKHTVAFVQFHNFQQADQAITYDQRINYCCRPLRIELCKAGHTRRNKIVEYFQSLPRNFPD
ncbi:hypothetical protein ASPCAL10928 [Aspergillus calidoustus]|uniref:RRM domain-containing protein n=1 Tax=Aspergillus calidoustus TaxID=454130 RepID=A0A0U5GAW1_ASPCI|nr:hypothetical protein ASPCAL10928 [Aspergillus calidoustus]